MKKTFFAAVCLLFFFGACESNSNEKNFSQNRTRPYLIVLGVAQDGGFPQAGCRKNCCEEAWKNIALRRFVSSLALVDPPSGARWLFDCTPDFKEQHKLLDSLSPAKDKKNPDGIFLTHAHIGHYAGLINLGREVMSTKQIPVYAMPRMKNFLEQNGPWSLLVELKNISIVPMQNDSAISLTPEISVTPVLVPHRDEFSETVGFRISCNGKSVLFIPDIDKWSTWSRSIVEEIKKSDIAFIDGTFYNAEELPGRNLKEIPHPLIEESMQLFSSLSSSEKNKIHFIHLNHTNPALNHDSKEFHQIINAGFHVAEQGEVFEF